MLKVYAHAISEFYVQEQHKSLRSDNGTNELKLAMMPTIATNNKRVQYANLKIIEAIFKSSRIEPVCYI